MIRVSEQDRDQTGAEGSPTTTARPPGASRPDSSPGVGESWDGRYLAVAMSPGQWNILKTRTNTFMLAVPRTSRREAWIALGYKGNGGR
jgi:hypothetical protein